MKLMWLRFQALERIQTFYYMPKRVLGVHCGGEHEIVHISDNVILTLRHLRYIHFGIP